MPIMQTANARYVVASQEPTAQNDYTWYRKYSDGWVEQGGRTPNYTNTGSGTGTTTAVVLPITMANTGYSALCSLSVDDDQTHGYSFRILCIHSKTTTGFTLEERNNNTSNSTSIYGTWVVRGMSA